METGLKTLVKVRCVASLKGLTHCPLKPFGTYIQIPVGANVARGYIDTENIIVSTNLQWKLSDQLSNPDIVASRYFFDLQ